MTRVELSGGGVQIAPLLAERLAAAIGPWGRVVFLVGFWGAVWVHDLVARPRLADIRVDLRPLAAVALPAIATNLAAPVSTAWVLRVFSAYGEPVIAAGTRIRFVPVSHEEFLARLTP